MRKSARQRAAVRAEELARSYAQQFDGTFETVAQIARTAADFVAIHPHLSEQDLYNVLRSNVMQSSLVYGSCIAFTPHAFDEQRRLFAPYAYRDQQNVVTKDLATKGYDYTDQRWEWYYVPTTAALPIWTEPYYDEGGGNILMCTYSVPFMRQGKMIGVVTVDVALSTLRSNMGLLDTSDQGFVLLSRHGRFISHPNPEYVMNVSVLDESFKQENPELSQLFRSVKKGESGVVRIPKLETNEPYWISYAPIASTGLVLFGRHHRSRSDGPHLRSFNQEQPADAHRPGHHRGHHSLCIRSCDPARWNGWPPVSSVWAAVIWIPRSKQFVPMTKSVTCRAPSIRW